MKLNVFHYLIFIMLEYYGLCKCQMTKEQFNLHGIHHKLKDDNHDFRIFEQPLLKHKRDNTLQQYVERYVKQCNPSITLTKQYFNNTLSVNISDNKDIKSIFKVWSTKHYPYSCIVYDCSSYKQLVTYDTRNIACSIGDCKKQSNSGNIILCNYYPVVSVNNRPDEAYKDESNTNSYTVTIEVPPETTSYMLDRGRCECIC
ncbi:hypothetical protein MS3_00008336 [Schistosoma haematobium]|uniref:SCP domain-containing protein n=2 Tax=Schistosoma haematobium TaxID=6185 RepID=A0A922LF39_SCHHA|nr:hypothetical protein MS3_00008336 [Schistosoma haematobium]KAH9581096.1 hypothetical protein MS3_00008336 [Schistosoma haematobium]CAH8625791.1 unnamed protein product [Schistosoma haematobium]